MKRPRSAKQRRAMFAKIQRRRMRELGKSLFQIPEDRIILKDTRTGQKIAVKKDKIYTRYDTK